MILDQTTISILSQVVYKEMCEDRRKSIGVKELTDRKLFWEVHKEETLELARNIIRANQTINQTK